MKITENLTELVVELGELETFERAGLVIDCDGLSLKKLLELFNETNNRRSKEVVREIFDEAGFGCFLDLDESAIQAVYDLGSIKSDVAKKDRQNNRESIQVLAFDGDEMFSEAEFLDLTPASTYFH